MSGSILPSLLDRLHFRDDPNYLGGQPLQTLEQFRNAVRRDLEDLLNLRWRLIAAPPGYDALRDSLFTIGVPDLSITTDFEERHRLMRHIEAQIRRHDPRFVDVQVKEDDQAADARTLRLHITAEVWVDLDRTRSASVELDTELRLSRETFRVRVADHD
ncbi:MAG TPA: type VI secretion system baseplate subunit TssE [Planctomycetaceae bacterium]|nr:type VI secretion system baseplate subunit TssE [Planctomycetaceae bacterium]HRF00577.1 type VI secretion system baseplate subunit TssE [Pirellulaceae bacterium]